MIQTETTPGLATGSHKSCPQFLGVSSERLLAKHVVFPRWAPNWNHHSNHAPFTDPWNFPTILVAWRSWSSRDPHPKTWCENEHEFQMGVTIYIYKEFLVFDCLNVGKWLSNWYETLIKDTLRCLTIRIWFFHLNPQTDVQSSFPKILGTYKLTKGASVSKLDHYTLS